MTVVEPDATECEWCGTPLAPRARRAGSPRRFCGTPCRQASHGADKRAAAECDLDRLALLLDEVGENLTVWRVFDPLAEAEDDPPWNVTVVIGGERYGRSGPTLTAAVKAVLDALPEDVRS